MKLKDPTRSEGCEEESEYEDNEEEPHPDEDNEDCLDIGNDEELEDEGESSTSKIPPREPVIEEEKPDGKDAENEDEVIGSDQEKSFEVIDQQLVNEIRKREKRNRKRKPIEWHCVHCGLETPIIRVSNIDT